MTLHHRLRARSFALAIWLPLLLFLPACRTVAKGSGTAAPASADAVALSVHAPCAEHLFVRNYSSSDQSIVLTIDGRGHPLDRIPRKVNPNARYASRVVVLPKGGAVGTVAHGSATTRFNTRSLNACARSLRDSLPIEAEADYWILNADKLSDIYPGIVAVTWELPLDTAGVDSLLLRYDAWIVRKSVGNPYRSLLWIAGDDSSGTLAMRMADRLAREPTVRRAVVDRSISSP